MSRGLYRDIDGHVDYLALLKWKFYLLVLKWKLIFHDLMVDWYYRWYLKRATLTLPNSIVCSTNNIDHRSPYINLLGNRQGRNSRLEVTKSEFSSSNNLYWRNFVSGIIYSLASLDSIVDM